jgi:hypothetical protein
MNDGSEGKVCGSKDSFLASLTFCCIRQTDNDVLFLWDYMK